MRPMKDEDREVLQKATKSGAKSIKGIDEPLDLVERGDQQIRRRAGKVQMSLRLQQVATWMLEGHRTKDVMKLGADKWGVSERTVERYVKDAKDQIEAMAATEFKSATTLALYRLMELYHAAIEDGDYKTALDVVKTQNRMLGLNAPDRIEAKTVENWDSMSVAEQLEQVSRILERAGAGSEGAEGASKLN